MTTMPAESAPVRRDSFRVLAFLCVLAAIAYIQRAAISVPAAEIARDLQFRDLARDMGWIQSTWYFCYALLQLPSGWLADRIGSRHALALFALLWSVATLACSVVTGFSSLLFFWGLMGAAQAGAFPCAAKAIGDVFPEAARARASGLLATGMAVGGAIAPVLTASLLERFLPLAADWNMHRWRFLLLAYALPGVVWAVLFLIFVSTRQLPVGVRRGAAQRVDWSLLFRSKSLALLCGQQFFRAAGMVFFLTWFPTFLQQTRGVSVMDSGLLTTLAGAGAALGGLTGGFCSDWLLQRTNHPRLARQGVAVAGIGLSSLLIVASYFARDVHVSMALISIGAFSATFGGVSGYTVAISFGGRHVATVFSSMNMCGNFGAALFPITAGWLVSRTGDWNLILFLFAAMMAIDAVCWALLNPQGTLFGDDHESPRAS